MNKENQTFLRVLDLLSDVLLVILSMLLAYVLRFRILRGAESMPPIFYFRCSLGISLLFLLLFAVSGLYESRRHALILHLVQRILLISLCYLIAKYVFKADIVKSFS